MRKSVQINDEEFIKAWKEGASDIELVVLFNCGDSYVKKKRKELNLPANKKSNKIDLGKLEELFYQGLNSTEIAKQLLVSPSTVLVNLKKLNLELKDHKQNPKIELTHSQKEVLFGSIMGDAYVQIQQVNAEIIFQHSIEQKEYVEYKANYFNNCPMKLYEFLKKADKRTGKKYNTFTCRLYANESFNELRNIFYSNSIKHIPIEYLQEYYTPLAMAVHFCDDGTREGNSYSIATMSFTKEDLEAFKRFLFIQYDIECTITGANRIRIRKTSAEKFKNLILPYIPICMQYKLHNVVS